jgi:hypothetical protein
MKVYQQVWFPTLIIALKNESLGPVQRKLGSSMAAIEIPLRDTDEVMFYSIVVIEKKITYAVIKSRIYSEQ